MVAGQHGQQAHTADSVVCEQCGGNVRLQGLPAWVTCPFCGHQQALSQARVGHVAAYQHQVGAQHRAADEHAQYVAAIRVWHDERDQRATKFGNKLFFTIFGGFCLLAGLIGAALASVGIIEWMMLPSIVIMGGFFPAMVVFYAAYFIKLSKAQQASGERAEAVTVACPSCGAPGTITPGDAVDQCRHCNAALIPTHTIAAQAVDRARQVRQRAALERYRTEREATSSAYSRSAGSKTVYIVLAPWTFMLLFVAVLFTYELFTGEGDTPAGGLAILWLITLAPIAIMLGVYAWRRSRVTSVQIAMNHLARQFGGQALFDIDSLVGWLNTHWAGPYELQQLYVSYDFACAALWVGGYPVLVDYCPKAPDHGKKRVQLLIGAYVPGASDGGPPAIAQAAHPHDASLRSNGWFISYEEGGIVLSANPALMKELVDPNVLHALAPIAQRGMQLAVAAGCSPVALPSA